MKDRRKYNHEYYLAHKVEHNVRSKVWYEANRDIISIRGKKWRDANLDLVRQRNKLHVLNNHEDHKKRCRDYQRHRRQVDPGFRILSNLRRRVSHVVSDGYRSIRTIELIGHILAIIVSVEVIIS
jgi:hypothetical protein